MEGNWEKVAVGVEAVVVMAGFGRGAEQGPGWTVERVVTGEVREAEAVGERVAVAVAAAEVAAVAVVTVATAAAAAPAGKEWETTRAVARSSANYR